MPFQQDLASALDRVSDLDRENRRLMKRNQELEAIVQAHRTSPAAGPMPPPSQPSTAVALFFALGAAVLIALFAFFAWFMWTGMLAGMRE